jgi:Protein of unknown function (DUF3303)
MLFIVTWTARPEHRNAAFERFVKTGGKPPKGVKFAGRWHAVGRITGFAIAETNDLALIQQWALDWSDLLSMDVYPALTDEQVGPLIAAAIGKR